MVSKRSTLLVLIVLPLVVANLLLLRDVRQLRTETTSLQRARLRQKQVAVGSPMPPLLGKLENGHELTVSYAATERHPTLLLVFSQHCGFCDDNWPAWNNLRVAVARYHTRVFGISLADRLPSDYRVRLNIHDLAIISEVEPRSLLAYHFGLTPQTLVLDASGTVRGIWSGVLSQADLTAVVRTIEGL